MRFQCEYEYSTRMKKYICEVVGITKKFDKRRFEVIAREHVPGKTNADVRILRIRLKQLKGIPTGLFAMFPYLKMLTIVNCGIKTIAREDLCDLRNIEFLNFSRNKLKALPDDLFADTPNLREIYFDDNKIEIMSSRIFESIEQTLKKAVFSGNTRIKEIFDKKDPFRADLTEFKKIVDQTCLPPPKSAAEDRKAVVDETEQREQMCETFSGFKTTGNFADTSVKVRGREFKVHKFVLAAQSPVFKQMFSADSSESEQVFQKMLNVSVSEQSFESFIDFFYSSECGPEVNALEMFELASVFDVSSLKATCAARIMANLNETNALEVFNLAHRRNADEMKLASFKIIQKMIPDIPSVLMEKPNYINRLVAFKKESEVALKGIIAEGTSELEDPETATEEAGGSTSTEGRFLQRSWKLAKRVSKLRYKMFGSCNKK